MKKVSSILYKVALVLDLVSIVAFVAILVLGIVYSNHGLALVFDNGTPEGMALKGSGLIWIGIGGLVLSLLGLLFDWVGHRDVKMLPSWKRPHAVVACFGIFHLNVVSIVAGILGLLATKEEETQVVINKDDPLSYLHLNRQEKFVLKFAQFFIAIPGFFKKIGIAIGRFFKKLGLGIAHFFINLVNIFKGGNMHTRLSYILMGWSNFANKQFLRGCLFALMEVVFIVYMIFVGGKYLGQLGTLGTVASRMEEVEIGGIVVDTVVYVDNSFLILLFGVLSLFFIVGFAYTWYANIKQAYAIQKIKEAEQKLLSDKDDLHALVDQDFYKALLALPLIGILVFTILPIFFMILVAFTNYDKNNFPPQNLFTWVGFKNFQQLFTWTNSGGASFSATFGQILAWTLVWAFFATFTNYFIGMLVAMLINKKGIKLKKLWRTVLVFSIAIPQFISLLYVSKMFSDQGIVNGFLFRTFGLRLPFWQDEAWARVTVIIINIWIGIPYLMLITTGILMNIPADLYESSKIDGASPAQQYMKITLPYMLFVTGPYLLTSFTGNMNNFNVIFLLTGGAPKTGSYYGSAGKTDLLITWLYSLTVDQTDYKLAAVIGILIFVVVAVLSLVVYNLIPSTKNEEDFA